MFDIHTTMLNDPEKNDLTSNEIKSVLRLIWTIAAASNTPHPALSSILLSVAASISANMGHNTNLKCEDEARKFFKMFQERMIKEMNKAFEEGLAMATEEE